MDHTGSYVYSFYMTGAVLMVAFLIPMILIPINHRSIRGLPQSHINDDKQMVTERSKGVETKGQTSYHYNKGEISKKGSLRFCVSVPKCY